MNITINLNKSQLERYQLEWDHLLNNPQKNPLLEDLQLRAGFTLENELCIYTQNENHNDGLLGSGLIVPKTPRATVFDLTPQEWAATGQLLEQVKAHLDTTLKPEGYTIGWNVHPAGGQHLPQAHLHIIPRFARDPFAGYGLRYFFRQCVKQMKKNLE
jgi:diadenosine tetraphosphate (Ap4A) HIT family hydrolase